MRVYSLGHKRCKTVEEADAYIEEVENRPDNVVLSTSVGMLADGTYLATASGYKKYSELFGIKIR